MILQEISQILEATRKIFSSQEEQILTTFRNIPSLQEVIEDQKFHDKYQDEYIEEIKCP
jgi:hypothetical protein